MQDQIFLLNQNKLIELNESDFIDENQFQTLLADYPKLISGSQINSESPRKWILISREVGIPGEEGGSNIWSLDHLFIDQDGIPTLVEVKRSTDTRTRREVVAQMLDYAANSVSYWSIDEIRMNFEKRCEQNNSNPDIELTNLLGEEVDFDKFWDSVHDNLSNGKIRLLFIADKIPKESPFDIFEKRNELLRKLNELKGTNILDNKIDKRPSFAIAHLKDEKNLTEFLKIYDWFLSSVEGSQN